MIVQNLTSIEAYKLIQSIPTAILIDVRTNKEWQEEGVPLLNDQSNVLLLSWRQLPDMTHNHSFIQEILTTIHDDKTQLFFLCRSGTRSSEAANFVSNHGYLRCYNITDGFVGNLQEKGWKNNKLPWKML